MGSGITGAFAAHFLKEKRPDLEIVMLEAREACWGATGRVSTLCNPTFHFCLLLLAHLFLPAFLHISQPGLT